MRLTPPPPSCQVSLQNEQSKRFLGGAEENVTCFAQAATETEKWTLHLAVHPNVAIFNPSRKRYVRCDEKAGALRCDRDMPWGAESVITVYYDFRGGWRNFPTFLPLQNKDHAHAIRFCSEKHMTENSEIDHR